MLDPSGHESVDGNLLAWAMAGEQQRRSRDDSAGPKPRSSPLGPDTAAALRALAPSSQGLMVSGTFTSGLTHAPISEPFYNCNLSGYLEAAAVSRSMYLHSDRVAASQGSYTTCPISPSHSTPAASRPARPSSEMSGSSNKRSSALACSSSRMSPPTSSLLRDACHGWVTHV